ncbi:MAG: hypothetical protein M3461_07940 [Pseudomonadota bacterium]|nr:hypothetical protein [Pseudomonadota bacterium]
MAAELLLMARGEGMRLTINGSNPFIQRLAKQSFHSLEVQDLMRGVYNNAILYNQELLTASNAKIFHDQFAALLERSLNYVEESSQLEDERRKLEKERQRMEALSQPKQKPSTARCFLCFLSKVMTPSGLPFARSWRMNGAFNFIWRATASIPRNFARMSGCTWILPTPS